jgi:hypothetical protein
MLSPRPSTGTIELDRSVDVSDIVKFQAAFYAEIWRMCMEQLVRALGNRANQHLPTGVELVQIRPDLYSNADGRVLFAKLYALLVDRYVDGHDLLIREDDAYDLVSDDLCGDEDPHMVRTFLQDLLFAMIRDVMRQLTVASRSQREGFRRIMLAINRVSAEQKRQPVDLIHDLGVVRKLIALVSTPKALRSLLDGYAFTVTGAIQLVAAPNLWLNSVRGADLAAAESVLTTDDTFATQVREQRNAYARAIEENIKAIWPPAPAG